MRCPPVPDADLTEIIDEVFLPLIHGRTPAARHAGAMIRSSRRRGMPFRFPK
jgi:hypothetical protein